MKEIKRIGITSAVQVQFGMVSHSHMVGNGAEIIRKHVQGYELTTTAQFIYFP